jgi:hypothetical protein
MSQDRVMNVFFLFTGSGSLVILTSYSSVEDPALLRKLAAKGIEKFLCLSNPDHTRKGAVRRALRLVRYR